MQTDYKSSLNRLCDFGIIDCSCVLFIGPEFIKFDGEDCNLAFYNTLPDSDEHSLDKKKAKYNIDEKIWSFTSIPDQRNCYFQLANFYKEHRDINNPIFHKLASIPFSLIVSLIPDDTLSAAFSQYENFNFEFKSFLLDDEVPEPSKDNMLIYNIYGNIRNHEYVASYSDYLNFIRATEKQGFPRNFSTAIKKANYLIFIGFEFDKWYNILLLYILNLIKSGSIKYAVEDHNAEELYNKLSDSSLNMMFIEKNSEQFINDLYNKAKSSLRKLIPQKEYVMKMIKSNEEAINKTKERIEFCPSPLQKKNLELDLEILEKDNNELINRLKKME